MISAFITNYNHGQYLAQAIEGIIDQSYGDIELIIIDDGSTDNSLDVISYYKEFDARVIAEVFPENRGCEAAVKRAVELCKGEYIFAGAADDYLVWQGFFEAAMETMDNTPCGIAYAQADIILNGHVVHTMGSGVNFLNGSMFIPGASAVLRRKCFDDLGGYDFNYGSQADFFVNHAVAFKYGAKFIPEVAAHVRQFANSMSVKDDKRSENYLKVQAKLREMFPDMGNDMTWAGWRKAYGVG